MCDKGLSLGTSWQWAMCAKGRAENLRRKKQLVVSGCICDWRFWTVLLNWAQVVLFLSGKLKSFADIFGRGVKNCNLLWVWHYLPPKKCLFECFPISWYCAWYASRIRGWTSQILLDIPPSAEVVGGAPFLGGSDHYGDWLRDLSSFSRTQAGGDSALICLAVFILWVFQHQTFSAVSLLHFPSLEFGSWNGKRDEQGPIHGLQCTSMHYNYHSSLYITGTIICFHCHCQ